MVRFVGGYDVEMPLGGKRDYMWGGLCPLYNAPLNIRLTQDPGPTLQLIL